MKISAVIAIFVFQIILLHNTGFDNIFGLVLIKWLEILDKLYLQTPTDSTVHKCTNNTKTPTLANQCEIIDHFIYTQFNSVNIVQKCIAENGK